MRVKVVRNYYSVQTIAGVLPFEHLLIFFFYQPQGVLPFEQAYVTRVKVVWNYYYSVRTNMVTSHVSNLLPSLNGGGLGDLLTSNLIG